MSEDPAIARVEIHRPPETPKQGITIEFAKPGTIFDEANIARGRVELGSFTQVSQTIDHLEAIINTDSNFTFVDFKIGLPNHSDVNRQYHKGFYDRERANEIIRLLKELEVEGANYSDRDLFDPDSNHTSNILIPVQNGWGMEFEVRFGFKSQSANIGYIKQESRKYRLPEDMTKKQIDKVISGNLKREIKIQTSFRSVTSAEEFASKLRDCSDKVSKVINAICSEAGETPPIKKITFGLEGLQKIDDLSSPKAEVLQNSSETQNKDSAFQEMFYALPEIKPEERDEKYFIDEKESLKQLELVKPFFVNIKLNPNGTFSYEVNREVVPYVHEAIAQSQRFQQAETATGGDSGLFAICAVAAETPAKQAEAYTKAAESVLKVHENNHSLLINWLGKQMEQGEGNDFPPFFVFSSFDHAMQAGIPQPRPGQEQLVAFAYDQQTNNYDFAKFEKTWQERMEELKTSLKTGKVEPHHIRWIEFLSHSVNKTKLFDALKLALP